MQSLGAHPSPHLLGHRALLHVLSCLPAAWLRGGQCSLGAAHPRLQSPPPRWRHWGPAVERNIDHEPWNGSEDPKSNPLIMGKEPGEAI